ncbi:MAG: DUF4386 family protein [Spirochaetia bacterium]|jgi:hypothetical protein
MQISQPDFPTTEATDRQWRSLYCVSGAIFLLTTVLSFVVAWGARTLYSSGYPADPASYLQLVSQHQALANLTWSLWIVLDFLSLPVIFAMYLVLRRHNHTLAALAGLLCLFYAVYDFGVTELNSLTLVSLSHSYAEATGEAARATLAAAAAYGYYALPLQTVLSFAIGPLGYLLWCVPMAKSFFGRWWAIVGAIVSLIGLAGAVAPVVPGSYILGLCQFICVRAIALWFVPLGVLLLRYGHRLGIKAR